MNIYEKKLVGERILNNPYVGRGIVIGKSQDGENAVIAYFIMGRSENTLREVMQTDQSIVAGMSKQLLNITYFHEAYFSL